MKVETLKDASGEAYDTSITLPQEELEKRHQTRVVEITVKMPDGRFARAFVHAASGPRGVQFELTCFKKTGEKSVRAIANYREPRLSVRQVLIQEEDAKVLKAIKKAGKNLGVTATPFRENKHANDK